VKAGAARAIGLENPLDEHAVEAHMGIEQGAKAVDESDRTDARGRTRLGSAPAQALLHRTEEDVQRQSLYGRVALQVVAQALRHRQHPLAHRQPRHDVVRQMGGGLDHAPRVAGRTHAPALTRVGDEEVVTALATAGTGKAVGENATFEVAAKFVLDVGRH
jgi:hypothetical protein